MPGIDTYQGTASGPALDAAGLHYSRTDNPHGITLLRLGASNRNILHNYYFRNLVNQRGATSYASVDYAYTIDRWLAHRIGVYIQSDGVRLTANPATSDNFILQFVENHSLYAGKTLTLSVKAKSITGYAYGMIFSYDGSAYTTGSTPQVTADGTAQCTITLPPNPVNLFVRLYVTSGTGAATFESAKVELGSVSTLANEGPPDYGEQLSLCQGYCIGAPLIGLAYYITPSDIYFLFNVPATLRLTPSLSDVIFVLIKNGENQSGFSLSADSIGKNFVIIKAVKASHGITTADGLALILQAGILSADL